MSELPNKMRVLNLVTLLAAVAARQQLHNIHLLLLLLLQEHRHHSAANPPPHLLRDAPHLALLRSGDLRHELLLLLRHELLRHELLRHKLLPAGPGTELPEPPTAELPEPPAAERREPPAAESSGLSPAGRVLPLCGQFLLRLLVGELKFARLLLLVCELILQLLRLSPLRSGLARALAGGGDAPTPTPGVALVRVRRLIRAWLLLTLGRLLRLGARRLRLGARVAALVVPPARK